MTMTSTSKLKVGSKVRYKEAGETRSMRRLEGVILELFSQTCVVKVTLGNSSHNTGEEVFPNTCNLELLREEAEEVRSVSSTGGEKGTKPERFELIPVPALSQLARMYARGAEKYKETCAEPNWRKGYEWSKSYAAMQRHANQFWSGEDIDEETQLPHMAAVAFHAFTLLTFMEERKEFDDRYKGARSE